MRGELGPGRKLRARLLLGKRPATWVELIDKRTDSDATWIAKAAVPLESIDSVRAHRHACYTHISLPCTVLYPGEMIDRDEPPHHSHTALMHSLTLHACMCSPLVVCSRAQFGAARSAVGATKVTLRRAWQF